jgi:hypothetical protein
MNRKLHKKITPEQTAAYNILKNDFAERLRAVFQTQKFTKIDICLCKERFLDLDERYKNIFSTKWSFFDYEERLGNLIAYTGILNSDFKMENGTYFFIKDL